MQEVRMPAKFIRAYDTEDQTYEAVLSKWYYEVEVQSKAQRLYITLHQEDERKKGVKLRRPYCDVSLAVLRLTESGVELHDLKDIVVDRSLEIEVNLDPGRFIILPRTTGCLSLRKTTSI